MKASLPVLQREYGFKKMYFWGKLKGMSGDYYIAQGVSYSLNDPDKKFFWWYAPACCFYPLPPRSLGTVARGADAAALARCAQCGRRELGTDGGARPDDA